LNRQQRNQSNGCRQRQLHICLGGKDATSSTAVTRGLKEIQFRLCLGAVTEVVNEMARQNSQNHISPPQQRRGGCAIKKTLRSHQNPRRRVVLVHFHQNFLSNTTPAPSLLVLQFIHKVTDRALIGSPSRLLLVFLETCGNRNIRFGDGCRDRQ
jgi:hypothetical protein